MRQQVRWFKPPSGVLLFLQPWELMPFLAGLLPSILSSLESSATPEPEGSSQHLDEIILLPHVEPSMFLLSLERNANSLPSRLPYVAASCTGRAARPPQQLPNRPHWTFCLSHESAWFLPHPLPFSLHGMPVQLGAACSLPSFRTQCNITSSGKPSRHAP